MPSWYRDPNAPAPNQPLRVGVVALIERDGRLLVERRADDGTWGLVGGALEADESVSDALVRELREETGLTATSVELFGVFSDPSQRADTTTATSTASWPSPSGSRCRTALPSRVRSHSSCGSPLVKSWRARPHAGTSSDRRAIPRAAFERRRRMSACTATPSTEARPLRAAPRPPRRRGPGRAPHDDTRVRRLPMTLPPGRGSTSRRREGASS